MHFPRLGRSVNIGSIVDYIRACLPCISAYIVMQLINDPEVEAVVICSPTDQHATQIMAAAKAGKRIFCEKPISLSLEIIDEVRH